MPKYIDNNITFNNVSEIAKTVSSAPLGKLNNYTFNNSETEITAINKKVFNAVDIDWNGADIDGTIINTTGELLSLIKNGIRQGETGPQGFQGEQGPKGDKGDTGTFDSSELENYASKTYVGEKIAEVVGAAPDTLDTLKEIADKLGNNDTALGSLNSALEAKANTADVYNKTEVDLLLSEVETIKGDQGETGPQGSQGTAGIQGAIGMQGPIGMQGAQGAIGEVGPQGATGSFDPSALESYATTQYVDSQIATIVGGEDVSANFDSIKEIADAISDLKVIDVPAAEAIPGEHFTQEEIDTAQEGDDAYGKTTEDWKVEPVPAVEEVSHNMTIAEFVTTAMQAVNEKPEVQALQTRMAAIERAMQRMDANAYQAMLNSLSATETLETLNTVTIEEGTIADIIIPETTKSKTVTGELDPNSTLSLTSRYGVTINNTSEIPTNLEVNAPADTGAYSAATITLKDGEFDTVTLTDASLTVSNDATVQNVVITSETTKSTTINATFVEGATITSNSEAPITVTNKNVEGEEVSVTLNAPSSTVTLSGGKWTTISGEVSENTLIIKGSAKIQSLNLTKGNVIVEVPREEDIQSIISGEITLGEGYSITHRTYEITNENSSKLGGVGEMILQEDITRTSSIVAPLAPAYNAVWNLNNHNITVTGTPKSGVYLNRYTSNLEVKGTGVIRAEGSYGLWNSATGKIIVNDGVTIEAQTHAIYAEKGIIEINGGVFKLTNADTADKDANGNFKFLLNCYDSNYKAGTANIIVKGGKFYGFNPAESYGELGSPISFVAEGYESVLDHVDSETGLNVYVVRQITA